MKHLLALLGFALAVTVCSAPLAAQNDAPDEPAAAAAATFGGEITIAPTDAIGLAEAIDDELRHGSPVLLRGTVADVCQKKGCWVVISDGDRQMRVTFKDYGFFLPTDCSGSQALIQGVVAREEISEELARHYAEESKGEDPEAINGPQQVVTMVATAVTILPTSSSEEQ